jgi:general secretion pathway protein F/type IV pilus assembly protein PilC
MLAEALERTHQIPADSLAMIGVAEQSNTLDVVLIKVATQLETRTNRRLEIAVKLIEPLLLLVLAVFVGFVVLALLLPIFEGQSLG